MASLVADHVHVARALSKLLVFKGRMSFRLYDTLLKYQDRQSPKFRKIM